MKYRSYDSRPLAPARFAVVGNPFRQALEARPAGMIPVSQNGEIELCNGECDRRFGSEPDELNGEPVELLLPPEARGAHQARRPP